MARTFDTNDYFLTANEAFTAYSSAYTLFTWVYLTTGSVIEGLINRDAENAFRDFQFRINASNALEFISFGASVRTETGGTVSLSTWTPCIARYNGSNVHVFVNGTKSAGQTQSSHAATTQPWDIGGMYGNGINRTDAPLFGRLAYCTAWKVALTDAECQSLSHVHPFAVRPGSIGHHWLMRGTGDAPDVIGGLTGVEQGEVIESESPLVSLGSPMFVTRSAAAGGGTHPVNPFGHPFHGPFAGPIGI